MAKIFDRKQEEAKRQIMKSIVVLGGTFKYDNNIEYGYTFNFNQPPDVMREMFVNAINNNPIRDYDIMNLSWQDTLRKYNNFCRSKKDLNLVYCTKIDVLYYFLNRLEKHIMEL